MIRIKTRLLLLILLASTWIGPAPRHLHAIPITGLIIRNVGMATYTDESGRPYSSSSNIVDIQVRQVYGISIEPSGTVLDPGEILRGSAGNDISFPYSLINTGNGIDRYHLTVTTPDNVLLNSKSAPTGVIRHQRLYLDVNRNGLIDSVDRQYDNDQPPEVAPGESVGLIIAGIIAGDQAAGLLFIDIEGASNGDPRKIDRSNVLAVDIVGDGFVDIRKSAGVDEAFPREVVPFEIEFFNRGTGPLRATDILNTELDGDGNTESRCGLLVADTVPTGMEYVSGSASGLPNTGFVVFAGPDETWKRDEQLVTTVRKVGFFIPAELNQSVFDVNQRGVLRTTFRVNADLLPQELLNQAEIRFNNSIGLVTQVSNTVTIPVRQVYSVVVDDTDDDDAATGSGIESDPDDNTIIAHAAAGGSVDFMNEVWNFGTSADVISLFEDASISRAVETAVRVEFLTLDGVPLTDADNDGKIDTPLIMPGGRFSFLTRVYLPESLKTEFMVIAVRGTSVNDPAKTDLTFNIIDKIAATAIKVNVAIVQRISTSVQALALVEEPLAAHRISVFEYDDDGNLVRSKSFLTDAAGGIVYDADGQFSPLFNWMRSGFQYRIALEDEFKGLSYYLTSPFDLDDFNEVRDTGTALNRRDVRVNVDDSGTVILELPLDPAGYVFDAVTGERVDGACVTWYRCNDGPQCHDFTMVDPARLDFYPDGRTREQNPQPSGPQRPGGVSVGTGPGAFQFIYSTFNGTADEGYHFIEVDYDCGVPGTDPSLGDIYDPTRLDNRSIYDPFSGDLYLGQPFYVDVDFPQTQLLPIAAVPTNFNALTLQKTASPATAGIGDPITFTLRVANNNDSTMFSTSLTDQLPAVVRYRLGSTRINGASFPDPRISADGGTLIWDLGDLTAGEQVEIRFVTLVMGNAGPGEYYNAAFAESIPVDPGNAALTNFAIGSRSNTAYARFRIVDGLFSDRGYVIGKVFIDANDNRVQDPDEQGVKGARIYSEFGRYVVTDDEGKYHMDNVSPGTHVLKLDRMSIPPSFVPAPLTNRNMGAGDSAFVDIFPGDMFKCNFRLVPLGSGNRTGETDQAGAEAVLLQRLVDGITVDAGSGTVRLKHHIRIVNQSSSPLFELTYHERSSYPPQKGSAYLNEAPFPDPTPSSGAFSWNIPLLEPDTSIRIRFTSEMASNADPVRAELTISLEPAGNRSTVRAGAPVTLANPFSGVCRLTVYFDPGSAFISEDTQTAFERLIDALGKQAYERLYIRLADMTFETVAHSADEPVIRQDLYEVRKRAVRSRIGESTKDILEVIFE